MPCEINWLVGWLLIECWWFLLVHWLGRFGVKRAHSQWVVCGEKWSSSSSSLANWAAWRKNGRDRFGSFDDDNDLVIDAGQLLMDLRWLDAWDGMSSCVWHLGVFCHPVWHNGFYVGQRSVLVMNDRGRLCDFIWIQMMHSNTNKTTKLLLEIRSIQSKAIDELSTLIYIT